MQRILSRIALTAVLAVSGSAAVGLTPLASAQAVASTPAKCVSPVAGRCPLAGTGWVFVYSCEVGTCGYGYSFAAHHVADGPRGATGTWSHIKGKPYGVKIAFALSSGPDTYVATLNPHTGTGSGTETNAGGTFTFKAIENGP